MKASVFYNVEKCCLNIGTVKTQLLSFAGVNFNIVT
jgi:hypothetical protein